MGEVPVLGVIVEDDNKWVDTEDIDQVGDDETQRYKPEFVYPGAGEKEHEDYPLQEWLKTGTAGCDKYRSSGIPECAGFGVGGEVNCGEVLKCPKAVVIEQAHEVLVDLTNCICNRPVMKVVCPVPEEEMEGKKDEYEDNYISEWFYSGVGKDGL